MPTKSISTEYLKGLWQENPEAQDDDLGCLNDYGLDFSLIEAGTFEDQRADYYRYQISWGGPSSEFRYYKNGDIVFHFMDWFDGAHRDLVGNDLIFMEELGESFLMLGDLHTWVVAPL